jgi:hypothetical protein
MFVSEIIDDVIEVLGRCDRTKALNRLSSAVQALQDEGDWKANIGALDIRTFPDGNTLTLPRDVETPLAITSNGIPVFMRDEFYRYHLNGEGLTDDATLEWAWDDQGLSPTFMDIITPGPIIAYCDLKSDAGKQVRILGFDDEGRPLRQQLEDGSWVEGIFATTQLATGIPTAKPTGSAFKRLFAPSPMIYFKSATPHGLVTGAVMVASAGTGDFPQPFSNGTSYYVRVIDSTTVQFHQSRLASQTAQAPLAVTSMSPSSSLVFTDKRVVSARTQFQTPLSTTLTDSDYVSFFGTAVPAALVPNKAYPIRANGVDKFVAYPTDDDATNLTNPINVADSGSALQVRALKKAYPVTTLNFPTAHNVLTGDAVTIENVGGQLPAPLLTSTTYYVRKLSETSVTLHSTSDDATLGNNPITLTSLGSGTNSIVKIIPATASVGDSQNITTTVAHNLSQPSGSGAAASAQLSGGAGATATATVSGGGVNSISVTNAGSGYVTPPLVQITGGSGVGATAQAVLNGGAVTAISVITAGTGYSSAPTITIVAVGGSGAITSINLTNGGSGYDNPPIIKITGGNGSGATAKATVSGGVITSIDIVTGGTGYTAAPTIQIIPSGGSLVRFSSNGTMPAPLTNTTVYRVESPMGTNTFTIYTTEPKAVNLTSTGSGSLFVVVSRAFSIGFLPQWRVDATNFLTGQAVRFFSEDSLPITYPQIDSSTQYYLRKIDNKTVEFYPTLALASNNSVTTGRISTISATMGQAYLSTQQLVSVIPRDNYLDIDTTGYLGNLTEVKFTSNGTLPAPLIANATYKVTPVEGKLEVYNANGFRVQLTAIGAGTHSMQIVRSLAPVPATTLQVTAQPFSAGDLVTLETTGTLPTPVATSTNYYLRPIGPDTVEVYTTASNAQNTVSTTGRVSFYSTGTGTHRLVQVIDPPVVGRVTKIEKPMTDGYVRVFAWDLARDNDVTLLGDLHPTETQPSFRRIQISGNTTWVRMKYRRKHIELTSERDFINLDSKMAILSMVQSQELLLRKFADESERYRVFAIEYLNKRNRALDGPRTFTMQINADVMSNPTDWMD